MICHRREVKVMGFIKLNQVVQSEPEKLREIYLNTNSIISFEKNECTVGAKSYIEYKLTNDYYDNISVKEDPETIKTLIDEEERKL